MDIDLRIPVGLFFALIGLIMVAFGLTSDPAIYAKSLSINVNLFWGIVELIFGSLMVIFGRSYDAQSSTREVAPAVRYDGAAMPQPRVPRAKPPVRHG